MTRRLSYLTREIFDELEHLGYTTLFIRSPDPADFWEEMGTVIVDSRGENICYYSQRLESNGDLFRGRCPMRTYNRWHFYSPAPQPNNAIPTTKPTGTLKLFNNGVREPLVEEIISRSTIYEDFMW